jgi:4,5-dihydroxyphthalate decarboxylase
VTARTPGRQPHARRRRALTLVLRDYEFLTPLAAGDVASPDLRLTLMRDANALDRTLIDQWVDAGELSLSRHIARVANRDNSFIGIPFFTTGGFRQRGFFVRRDSDLHSFADLARARIGTNEWPATGSIWARAVLRDAGVSLDDILWWLGSVDGAPGKTTQQHDELPPHVSRAPADRTLSDMLRAGEVDALMCPRPPKDFYGPDATIRRLLPDYKAAEADYFRRNGIRPIAHIVGVRRSVYDKSPWTLKSLYTLLEESKTRWQARLRNLADALPWLLPALEETSRVFGQDWLPNGVEPNRRALQALVTEQQAQGLLAERVSVDNLFREFLDEGQHVE